MHAPSIGLHRISIRRIDERIAWWFGRVKTRPREVADLAAHELLLGAPRPALGVRVLPGLRAAQHDLALKSFVRLAAPRREALRRRALPIYAIPSTTGMAVDAALHRAAPLGQVVEGHLGVLLVVNVPLAGASAWLRGSLFGRALQSKSLCRGKKPGRALRRGIYRCIGITNTARSDNLTLFADWSAAAHIAISAFGATNWP